MYKNRLIFVNIDVFQNNKCYTQEESIKYYVINLTIVLKVKYKKERKKKEKRKKKLSIKKCLVVIFVRSCVLPIHPMINW